MIVLAKPHALALLAAVPLALLLRRRGRVPALPVGDIGPALAASRASFLSVLPGACRVLGLAALVLALAGPRLTEETTAYQGRGIDVMLAVDLSESMAAMDMRLAGRTVTRLEAVADAAARFAAAHPGDRIGLVAFGSRAYTVMPPTVDRAALAEALSRLSVGAAGQRTAMGDAVGLAVKRLAGADGLARLVVVFGDGRSNAGEVGPEEAARVAAGRGIVVHAVGVGGDAPAPFLVTHPLLGSRIVTEMAAVDATTLAALAETTGGISVRAEDAAGLDAAVDALSEAARSDMVPVATAEDVPLAPLCAALGATLFTCAAALAATRFLRLP